MKVIRNKFICFSDCFKSVVIIILNISAQLPALPYRQVLPTRFSTAHV